VIAEPLHASGFLSASPSSFLQGSAFYWVPGVGSHAQKFLHSKLIDAEHFFTVGGVAHLLWPDLREW
jgi:hypothetical protein